jgi:ATP adenylyltransferase
MDDRNTDILWAPWRMEYILGPKEQGCIFCDKPKQTQDRENLILHRGAQAFVIMNKYPYNNGHLLIVPYRHEADLGRLTNAESLEMMELLQKSAAALKGTCAPQGFNIGMNVGAVAGAGIDSHLHFHIVPRWNADTNFMPIIGHTKVVSEGLWETWAHLRERFQAQ